MRGGERVDLRCGHICHQLALELVREDEAGRELSDGIHPGRRGEDKHGPLAEREAECEEQEIGEEEAVD